MPGHLIAPSLLSADFANLQRDVEMLNRSDADWLHLDIMDGQFVPNLSFGLPVVKAIKRHSTKPLDVHLMIVDPDRYLGDFRDAGADILTVHYEACTHLHRTVQSIHALGMKAGVSLNPHSNVSLLRDMLGDIDMVLLMSVNPGFGGQKFIPFVLDKVQELSEMAKRFNPSLLIEVDGGVDGETAPRLLRAGANVLVAGNYVFASNDPEGTIRSLKQLTF
jgi:ribulose-phosphate 3-epimerase